MKKYRESANPKGGKMKKIIAIIILMSLNYNLNSESVSVVAKVNDINITRDEIINKMSIFYFQRTLNDLIEEKLLVDYAKKNSIKVESSEVEALFNQIKSRFKDDNEFKKELKKMNIKENEYKKMIENLIIADKAMSKILSINITDEDAKKYYETNKEQFKNPKALKLRQIFVSTEQEANDIYLALEAGADFKKLATLKTQDPLLKEKEGDIGFISKGMLLPDIEKEVFSLEPGKYTKPLKTGNGYSIIKVEEIRQERTISFDEIKDNLKESIKASIINQNRNSVINELKNKAKVEIK